MYKVHLAPTACPRSVTCLTASALNSAVYLALFIGFTLVQFLHHNVSTKAGEVQSNEKLTQELEKLVPASLDDIIRKNRDKCRLALATDEEMAKLESSVSSSFIQDSLNHWQILVIHLTKKDGTQVVSPRLIGRLEKSGQSWITSNVQAFDSNSGLVQTRSSVYKVIGERAAETDLDLMHICVLLHQWGLGDHFGVPYFFY